MNNSSRLTNECARVYSSKTFSLLSSRRPSSCNRSVSSLQTRVVLYYCVCSCRTTSVLMMSNHETVRVLLGSCTKLWWEAPTAIHLLAYFASCIVWLTPWNCTFIPLSLFAVSMWSNSAPMRVDAVDAVISHTDFIHIQKVVCARRSSSLSSSSLTIGACDV